jgi:TonB family protein
MAEPHEQPIVLRVPNHHAVGLMVACAVSLFIHALAFGAVFYWADWFGWKHGKDVPVIETIVVLGNVGGSAGSVKGNPEGSNEPKPVPPTAVVEPARPTPPAPSPAKPTLTVHDVRRSLTEAQQWLVRTTPQLPPLAKPQINLDIPSVPTETIQEAVKQSTAWVAAQLPKLKKAEPKKEPVKQEEAPKPTVAQKPKEEPKQPAAKPAEAPKQEPAKTVASPPRGNAQYNGNNRSGSGNVGSGGNNDGTDAAARLPTSYVAPPYPYEADRLNIEGTVRVLIEYDHTGRITRVSLDTSSGSRLLDDPVLDFIRNNWTRIHPRQERGRPTAGSVIVPFVYRKK